ncbi:hypothetical protein D9M72_562910 [compost metagenome]
MSSQTTDTPGTTTTTRSRIAPEQLPKLTRSRNTMQTGIPPATSTTGRIPTRYSHAITAPFSRPFRRGSVAISPHQRRRLELLYTPTAPHTNPPPNTQTRSKIPGIPRTTRVPSRPEAGIPPSDVFVEPVTQGDRAGRKCPGAERNLPARVRDPPARPVAAPAYPR